LSSDKPRRIFLREHEATYLASNELLYEEGKELWQRFSNYIDVEFPSPKTDDRWLLKPKGWVGHVPLSKDLSFIIEPKVELTNLFRMLEYAYSLKGLKFLDGLSECDSLEDFYGRLARILALRILDRSRQGLYRTYLPDEDLLPFVRGRIDYRRVMSKPWEVDLLCNYEDHTGDILDNQILVWTLLVIARSGLCSPDVVPTIRKAFRALQGLVSVNQFQSNDCLSFLYNRLNADYAPLHALCRFFLENSGPAVKVGDHQMIPFLVNMPQLFEQFVAQWLNQHLPKGWHLKIQEKLAVDSEGLFSFQADLLLFHQGYEQPQIVLDTKYKNTQSPSKDDIHQMIAYAEVWGCPEAILIYPIHLAKCIDQQINTSLSLKTVGFALQGDLERNGADIIEYLTK
jgi:5-methylcytosine-specific restriction enzyme subunit McrC